jgi:hypothetical protein
MTLVAASITSVRATAVIANPPVKISKQQLCQKSQAYSLLISKERQREQSACVVQSDNLRPRQVQAALITQISRTAVHAVSLLRVP